MINLTVIRHATTDANDAGITLGQIDTDINANGVGQTLELAMKLNPTDYDLIITSPLKRALETAKLLNTKLNLPLVEEPLILERNFGELSGLTWEEFERKYPELAKVNSRDFQANLPAGETIPAVENRVKAFVAMLQNGYPNKNILIVTHTGIIRILKRLLNNQTASESRQDDPQNIAMLKFQIA